MGRLLDSRIPFESYRLMTEETYFVDKSMLLQELIPAFGAAERFYCITRPRRFGKSVAANMIAAFFGKAVDAKAIFDKLLISSSEHYLEQLNQYHVVYIDFSELPRNCASYQQYIDEIQNGINEDLAETYPECKISIEGSVWGNFTEIFQKTGEKFLFVMDEWDAVFYLSFMTDADRDEYLGFLKQLLKGRVYVEFAYMTGIMPIAKYSDGSELNMFVEYNMATSVRFSEFFGFREEEVDQLFERYQNTTRKPMIDRAELREWYDGYDTAGGERLYNPRSVVCALTNNQLGNYWVSSGRYDSVFSYLKHNVAGVREDLALLFAGETVPATIQEYAATSMRLETRDEIYSAMVIYGLLTYRDGFVGIPNKELMDSYAAMLKKEKSLGYLYQLANVSRKMLEATLEGDTKTMAELLQFAHNTESPIFAYNSEIELAAIVNLVYLSARDQYRVEREDKAGKGYVDFIFYPERKGADAFILELKAGTSAEEATPEKAIAQIREKDYALRFRGKLGEEPRYTGRVLLVGIAYDKETKEHCCKVELL
jgi:hypothetical protein